MFHSRKAINLTVKMLLTFHLSTPNEAFEKIKRKRYSLADHVAVCSSHFLDTSSLQKKLWFGFKSHTDFLRWGMETRSSSSRFSFSLLLFHPPPVLSWIFVAPFAQTSSPPPPALTRAEQTSFVSTPFSRLALDSVQNLLQALKQGLCQTKNTNTHTY